MRIKNVIAGLLITACLQFSCESETPDLVNLLSRREVMLGGGGNNGGGTGGQWSYTGINADKVRLLLSRTSGWDATNPPSCTIKPLCTQRDSYVCGAVNYAWAAEMYARNGDISQATFAANEMMRNLNMADQLCSGPCPSCAAECGTWSIYPC